MTLSSYDVFAIECPHLGGFEQCGIYRSLNPVDEFDCKYDDNDDELFIIEVTE